MFSESKKGSAKRIKDNREALVKARDVAAEKFENLQFSKRSRSPSGRTAPSLRSACFKMSRRTPRRRWTNVQAVGRLQDGQPIGSDSIHLVIFSKALRFARGARLRIEGLPDDLIFA